MTWNKAYDFGLTDKVVGDFYFRYGLAFQDQNRDVIDELIEFKLAHGGKFKKMKRIINTNVILIIFLLLFSTNLNGSFLKRVIMPVTFSAALLFSPPVPAQDIWQPIPEKTEIHQAASHYFLLDAGNAFRIFHATHIDNRNQKSVFIGFNAFTLMNGESILDDVNISLVSKQGEVARDIKFEINNVYKHPDRKLYDIVTISIPIGLKTIPVDMDEWPDPLEGIEAVSFFIDNRTPANAFQPTWRGCISGRKLGNQLAEHSCAIDHHMSLGSPIFYNGNLVGLYGQPVDGLPAAVIFTREILRSSLDAEKKVSLTTTWGNVKTGTARN